MAEYEAAFRAAVRGAAEQFHPMAGDAYPIDRFVDDVVSAAAVYADEREADQPAPDGSVACMGPCCGGAL
jgi:hypothetical protein